MNILILVSLLGAGLLPTDFQYEGSMRLDEQWGPNNSTLEYSNGCLCVLPNGDLLVTGHVYGSKLKQFKVPSTLAKTRQTASMPMAAGVGSWVDQLAGTTRIGQIWGLCYRPQDGRVWWQSHTDYTDTNSTVPALGSFAWGTAGASGPFKVTGASIWNTGKYVTALPDGRLLVGRRRQSWGSSEGHNASWVTVPTMTGQIAMAFCAWTGSNTAACYSKEQSQADNYSSLAFVEGTLALGCIKDWNPAAWYYGYEGGKTPDQCEPTNTCQGQRGHRAGDARPTLLLIEPAAMQGGDTDWYDRLDLSAFFVHAYGQQYLSSGAEADTVFITYDQPRKRLYVSESYAEANRPVVHVFSVSGGISIPPPQPPPATTPPPIPTQLVVTYSHSGKDINGNSLVLDRSELRVVQSGSGSGGAAIATVAGTVPDIPGGLGFFVLSGLANPGAFDCWARVHSKAGWSSYAPAIQIVWPPSQPQPIQAPIPLTVPARPNSVTVSAK